MAGDCMAEDGMAEDGMAGDGMRHYDDPQGPSTQRMRTLSFPFSDLLTEFGPSAQDLRPWTFWVFV